jgi:hypothetical protein
LEIFCFRDYAGPVGKIGVKEFIGRSIDRSITCAQNDLAGYLKVEKRRNWNKSYE